MNKIKDCEECNGDTYCWYCNDIGKTLTIREPKNIGYWKSLIYSLKCKRGHTIDKSDIGHISEDYITWTVCDVCDQDVKLTKLNDKFWRQG